ncbi:MAG: hypothetical protein QM758_00405 [Armatimonas sp.]
MSIISAIFLCGITTDLLPINREWETRLPATCNENVQSATICVRQAILAVRGGALHAAVRMCVSAICSVINLGEFFNPMGTEAPGLIESAFAEYGDNSTDFQHMSSSWLAQVTGFLGAKSFSSDLKDENQWDTKRVQVLNS